MNFCLLSMMYTKGFKISPSMYIHSYSRSLQHFQQSPHNYNHKSETRQNFTKLGKQSKMTLLAVHLQHTKSEVVICNLKIAKVEI